MKRNISIAVISMLIFALFAGFLSFGYAQAADGGKIHGKIVVANRGSGDISVIDARRGELGEDDAEIADVRPAPVPVVQHLR